MGNLFFSAVIYPLTQFIEIVFNFCYKLTDSCFFSLMGVSLAVSFFTLPLYIVAESWQEKERDLQKKMQPTVGRIKKYFKKDEQYMILTTYYRQNGYHPIMSLRSAFGILIQIPFFTAAYTCLSHMQQLNGESFLFIADFGRNDGLFKIGSFTVNVLPLLMTMINMVSGAIYTKGLPIKDKLQVNILALVFVVLLYNSPSGLVIYWTMNNIFSLLKNVFFKLRNPGQKLYFIASAAAFVSMVLLFVRNRFAVGQKVIMAGICLAVILIPVLLRLIDRFVSFFLSDIEESPRRRTVLFFASTLSVVMLVGFVIPSLLIASSTIEFCGIDNISSPVFFIGNTFVQSLGLFFIWPTLIYFLFGRKIKTILAFLFFFAFYSFTVNVFFFQGNYGYLSKLLVFKDVQTVASPAKDILVNCTVTFLIAVVCSVVLKLGLKRIASVAVTFCGIAFFMTGALQYGKITKGHREYLSVVRNASSASSITPIFHLSKTGKNVVLFFIDRGQNSMLRPIFEESPELYDQFSGFTLYPNTVSYNSHTLMAVPAVHGGYEYTLEAINARRDDPLVQKHNEAMMMLPRIFTEQGKDWSAVSSDASWLNYSWIPDLSVLEPYPKIKSYVTEGTYTELWFKEHSEVGNFNISSTTLKRNLLWYSVFRTMPLFLRPYIYDNGAYWSTNSTNTEIKEFMDNYSVLDYLPELTDFSCGTENSFIDFTNNTTHKSFMLQYPDYVPVSEVTAHGGTFWANDASFVTMAGTMHRIGEWLDYLKENGVYDNTRIIIVSDHGTFSSTLDFGSDPEFHSEINPTKYNPLFMFKDFNENGKLKVDESFMTNADTPGMLLKDVIENPVNPFTGNAIPESAKEKERGALVSIDDLYMPHHSKSKNVFTVSDDRWYRVRNDIRRKENWTKEKTN